MKLMEVARRKAPSLAWRERNRDRYLAYQTKWRKQNPDKMRGWRGLPEAKRPYPEDHRCEICERVQKHRLLALDHCHETGRFRGWLCDRCNYSIALLEDDRKGVERAWKYMKGAWGAA